MRDSLRRQRAPIRLWIAALLGTAAGALTAPVGAQAANVVVGSPLTFEFKSAIHVSGLSVTAANSALVENGAFVSSPVTGTIVRWRTKGSYSGGGFRLRVLRPAGSEFVGAGASGFQTPTGPSMQVFSTDLPIQKGDLIGLDAENKEASFSAEGSAGGLVTLWSPVFPEGSTSPPVVENENFELGFDAEVQPAPSLILIGPTSGPLAGGTTVTIAGRDLEGATAVKFGPNAASAHVTVNSENEITAVSPPGAQPGPVDVTITTAGGTTAIVPADQFTYTAPSQPEPVVNCTVPKLIGKSLKTAKKRLTKAHCKLGKVGGKKSESAKIKTQNPKAGTVLAPGSKVSVKVK